MLATAVILFREVLEAALIVAIVLGASRGVPSRGRWVAAGVGLGLLGASAVALMAADLSAALGGNGQAVLNSVILLSAVAMLTWHNVWMSTHGRELAADVSAVGADVQSGARPLTALLIVTLLAVMREGSEAVLFLWAIVSGGGQPFGMLLGGAIGVAGGVAVGALLYRGLLRIPLRHFFSVTSWLILLLTAGLAAQAAGFLNQAGFVPSFGNSLWDTSGVLSQGSVVGQLLHILVGYIARPSGIELMFYVGTLAIAFALTRLAGRAALRSRRIESPAQEPAG